MSANTQLCVNNADFIERMWEIKRYSKGGIKVIILTFYTESTAETAVYIKNIFSFQGSESLKNPCYFFDFIAGDLGRFLL